MLKPLNVLLVLFAVTISGRRYVKEGENYTIRRGNGSMEWQRETAAGIQIARHCSFIAYKDDCGKWTDTAGNSIDHGGRILTNAGTYKIDDQGTLTVVKARTNDTGKYTPYKDVASPNSGTLVIRRPIRIFEGQRGMARLHEGDTLKLNRYSGKTWRWRVNGHEQIARHSSLIVNKEDCGKWTDMEGKVLENAGKYKVEDNGSLTIVEVKKSDAGIYIAPADSRLHLKWIARISGME